MKIICTECDMTIAVWEKLVWTVQELEDAKTMFTCDCGCSTVNLIEE